MPLLSLLPAQLYGQPALALHSEPPAVIQRSPGLLGQAGLQAPSLTSPHAPSTNRSLFPAQQQPAASDALAASPAAARGAPGLRSLVPAVAYSTKEKEPLSETLKRAGKRALGGGIPGAAAMGIQVRAGVLRRECLWRCPATHHPCCPATRHSCCPAAACFQVLSLMWLRTTGVCGLWWGGEGHWLARRSDPGPAPRTPSPLDSLPLTHTTPPSSPCNPLPKIHILIHGSQLPGGWASLGSCGSPAWPRTRSG